MFVHDSKYFGKFHYHILYDYKEFRSNYGTSTCSLHLNFSIDFYYSIGYANYGKAGTVLSLNFVQHASYKNFFPTYDESSKEIKKG